LPANAQDRVHRTAEECRKIGADRKTSFTVKLKNAGKLARIARPGLLEDLHPAAYFLKTWIA
jgi:hypothetical protein